MAVQEQLSGSYAMLTNIYLGTIRQSRISTGNVRRRLLRASSSSFAQTTLKHFTARQANVGMYWCDTTRLLKDPTTYTYRYFSSCMMAKVQGTGSSEVCFFHQSRHAKTHKSDEQHDAPPLVTHNMTATKCRI